MKKLALAIAMAGIGLVATTLYRPIHFMPLKEAARACLVPSEFNAVEFDYHWTYAHNLERNDPFLYSETVYPSLWQRARWYQMTHPVMDE